MLKGASGQTVLRVEGPVVLDWGNGVRIQLSPAGITAPMTVPAPAQAKAPGRRPSPATQTLRDAMQADAAAGTVRARAEYLTLLRQAGGPVSPNAAGIIVNREAKRIFGQPLSRLARAKPKPPKGKPGRMPGPAAFAVQMAMEADAAAHKQRTRHEYLRMLKDAGYVGSEANANVILRREAKRAFGAPLGRGKARQRKAGGQSARLQHRKEAIALLRAKLQEDAAKDDLRTPAYYVKWLVDQPNVAMGLRQARPMVYRELKPHRKAPEMSALELPQ